MLELLPGLQDRTSILLRRPAKIEGCQILSPQVFVPKNRFKVPKVSCSLDTHTLRTTPPLSPPLDPLTMARCSTNRTLALTEDVFSLAVDGVEVSFCKLLPSTVCLPSSGMHFWSPPMVPGGLGGINQDNHPPQNEFREPGHFRPVTFKFVV